MLAEERLWRDELENAYDETPAGVLASAVETLRPLETPWSRQLFVAAGSWTAYLNNSRDGGDPWPTTSYLARRLGVVAVVATCSAKSPHASTQFQLMGPTGVPPLLYVRTLAAHCEDGKWTWLANGEVQPFENVTRYNARRIRERLDRDLLVTYLDALDIHVDDPAFYGQSVAMALFR